MRFISYAVGGRTGLAIRKGADLIGNPHVQAAYLGG